MARHRIASWIGFAGGSLILATPMVLDAPETSMAAFHWVGVAAATLLLLVPVLATSVDTPGGEAD